MPVAKKLLSYSLFILGCVILASSPAAAQGKGKYKHYVVTTDRAVSVTRAVLINQGYKVVRVQRVGPTHVVYYRLGNRGNGKGQGPLRRLVIRSIRDRVVFEETEPSVLIDIDVKLKL